MSRLTDALKEVERARPPLVPGDGDGPAEFAAIRGLSLEPIYATKDDPEARAAALDRDGRPQGSEGAESPRFESAPSSVPSSERSEGAVGRGSTARADGFGDVANGRAKSGAHPDRKAAPTLAFIGAAAVQDERSMPSIRATRASVEGDLDPIRPTARSAEPAPATNDEEAAVGHRDDRLSAELHGTRSTPHPVDEVRAVTPHRGPRRSIGVIGLYLIVAGLGVGGGYSLREFVFVRPALVWPSTPLPSLSTPAVTVTPMSAANVTADSSIGMEGDASRRLEEVQRPAAVGDPVSGDMGRARPPGPEVLASAPLELPPASGISASALPELPPEPEISASALLKPSLESGAPASVALELPPEPEISASALLKPSLESGAPASAALELPPEPEISTSAPLGSPSGPGTPAAPLQSPPQFEPRSVALGRERIARAPTDSASDGGEGMVSARAGDLPLGAVDSAPGFGLAPAPGAVTEPDSGVRSNTPGIEQAAQTMVVVPADHTDGQIPIQPGIGAGIAISKRVPPDRVMASLGRAYDALYAGDTDTAAQIYRRVLRDESRNRDALLGLAAVAARMDRWDEAAAHYTRVLTIDPADLVAQASLIAIAEQDPVRGVRRLKTLLSREPRAAYLHFNLGNIYAAQARWIEAQQAYFNAYRFDRSNPDYAYNLAISLDHLAHSQRALDFYREALALADTHPANFEPTAARARIRAMTDFQGVDLHKVNSLEPDSHGAAPQTAVSRDPHLVPPPRDAESIAAGSASGDP